MPFYKLLSAKLGHVLVLYGGWGLFTISFLDSSFLSFPLINDLLLIHLASLAPGKALIYALQCAAGSVLGAAIVYAVARGGGDLLWRKRSSEKGGRVGQWLERNDFIAVVVASLLPPPVPFKIFAISAGVLRVSFLRFTLALVVGRGLRFGAGAYIGVRYGARAEAYLKANMGWASVGTVVFIVGATFLYRRLASRLQGAPPTFPGSTPSQPS